ncbi:MAG TPA: hypothetical protein VF844_22635 [Ktedonobacteraceae bacterium]
MSTLGEHTGNGKPTATSLQRVHTKEQLDGVLQQFDVLPSRFDRFLFKYIYVYMFGLLFLAQLLTIISLLGRNSQVGEILLQGVGFGVPPTVATILAIWRFNAWRWRTPNTLRDLWENKRIAVPGGDADRSYLCFLEHYRGALASPKRYFLSGFAMIFICVPFAYNLAQALSSEPPMIQVVGGLLYMFLFVGGFYCIGILTWAIYLSGWYVRKLVRAFQLSIRPFHPDRSGGLKLLGNFCFGLGSPLLIASGLFIGYSMFALVEYSPLDGSAYLVLNVYYPLLFVLLFALPGIVFVLMLPLRDIHTKMVSEAKTNENRYFTRTEALREEIQALLAVNQVEAAKAVQEEMALVETLYAPYPTWPFHVRSKISSTALEVGGSLLIGLISAALVEYFLPVIITLFIHTP